MDKSGRDNYQVSTCDCIFNIVFANRVSLFKEKEKPSARFLRLAKTSLKIKKIKTLRRHFSSDVKKKIQFDDTLSVNEEHHHHKANKLIPIVKKFASLLYATKSVNDIATITAQRTTDIDNNQDNKKLSARHETETYISYEDDFRDDIDKFCSGGRIEMDTDCDL